MQTEVAPQTFWITANADHIFFFLTHKWTKMNKGIRNAEVFIPFTEKHEVDKYTNGVNGFTIELQYV